MKNQHFIHRLQRVVCLFLLSGVILFSLTGCHQEESGEMTQITFERGSGSIWGNQFYIEVCPRQILLVRYFPEGSSQQQTKEQIPITQEQWDTLFRAVQALELTPEKTSFLQTLFGGQMLDGGEYRKLTLVWQTAAGEKEITYRWPGGPQADRLEQLLEQLANP